MCQQAGVHSNDLQPALATASMLTAATMFSIPSLQSEHVDWYFFCSSAAIQRSDIHGGKAAPVQQHP